MVTGAIDFGDVNWGDADYDFVYPLLDFGESFALDVARHYGHSHLDRLMARLRYNAIADEIGTILEEPDRLLPGQVEEAWRRLKRCDLLY